MTLILSGSNGITDVNGTAAAPAITGTDTDTGVFFGTNTVSLSTGGTERLQVDTSGNLGLGVTPVSYYAGYGTKVFQFAASGALWGLDVSSSDRRVGLDNNVYQAPSTGTDTYLNTGNASRYMQTVGKHIWYTASSGSAGTAINGGTGVFTQAMTLDASGNLGIGTTSPAAKLNVNEIGRAHV